MKTEKRPAGRPKLDTPSDKRVEIRVQPKQHKKWADAALKNGYTKGGKPNISAWLKALADEHS